MSVHAIVKGKKYELRVNLGRDPVTGRRRTTSRTFHGGERAAKRAEAEFVAEVNRGNHRGTDSTLADLLTEYLDQIGDELSPSTLRGYRRRITKRIVPALGRIPLRKLKAADLDRYYRALERTDPAHSPSDIRQDHAIISGALSQARDWGYVTENIAKRARPPRVPTGQVAPPPPPDVILALIAGAEAGTGHPNSKANPSFGLFLRLAAATGARPGELCALTLGDVDLEAGALTISRNVVEDGTRLIVKDTKTHQARKVALDPATAAVLAEHVERIGKQAADLGAEAGPGWFVFTHEPGGDPWRPGYVTLAFARLCARLGARVRLYDLRHAHATYLLIAGVDVRTIAGRLGHDPRITLRTYGHFLEAPDRAAALVAGTLLATSEEST